MLFKLHIPFLLRKYDTLLKVISFKLRNLFKFEII